MTGVYPSFALDHWGGPGWSGPREMHRRRAPLRALPLLGTGQWSGAQEWANPQVSRVCEGQLRVLKYLTVLSVFFPPNSKLILNLCLENNNKNFRKEKKKELIKQNQGQNSHQLSQSNHLLSAVQGKHFQKYSRNCFQTSPHILLEIQLNYLFQFRRGFWVKSAFPGWPG